MINVEFVCLGNICRSPLAEAIFQNKINQLQLQKAIQCDSSGTGAYHIGANPDPRSIKIAHEHHVPIAHKGRQFGKEDGKRSTYILAMDANNYRNIIHALAYKHEGLFLMRDFDPKAKGADVPDPYYGGEDGFKNVYEMLDRSIDGFLAFIIKKHHLK